MGMDSLAEEYGNLATLGVIKSLRSMALKPIGIFLYRSIIETMNDIIPKIDLPLPLNKVKKESSDRDWEEAYMDALSDWENDIRSESDPDEQ